jgi:hypothetical protein
MAGSCSPCEGLTNGPGWNFRGLPGHPEGLIVSSRHQLDLGVVTWVYEAWHAGEG